MKSLTYLRAAVGMLGATGSYAYVLANEPLELNSPELAVRYTPGDHALALRDIVTDSHGILELAQDGVVRSFNGEGQVLDYRNLDNPQIESFLASLGVIDTTTHDMIRRAVDGRDVNNKRDLIEPTARLHVASRDEVSNAVTKRTSVSPVASIGPEDCPNIECFDTGSCEFLRIHGVDCGRNCVLALGIGKRCNSH